MGDTPNRDGTPAGSWPGVSVVMPVLDEERYLVESVERVLAQDYPGPLEVVLALGPSRDRTTQVAQALMDRDARVRSIDNPTGRTAAALNAAIDIARYEVVARVDGHGVLPSGYLRRAVEVLAQTGADNVGGVMHAEGTTPFEHAVARAMTSRLGVGGGRFHVGGCAGPAKTVYLGVFRRDTLRRLGGYDEHFVRAQDWELNHRIRESGGLVWFTPELRVSYRPRTSLRALARQYRDYGRWRRVVMRRHEGTVSLRYLAPPLMVLIALAGTALGLVGLLVGPAWLVAGWLAPLLYLGGILAGSVALGRQIGVRAAGWLPPVLVTMHWSWGLGFLTSTRALAAARPDPFEVAPEELAPEDLSAGPPLAEEEETEPMAFPVPRPRVDRVA